MSLYLFMTYVLAFPAKVYIMIKVYVVQSYGHSDYVVHQDDVNVERILVATGEIQSMSDPDTQNSIYGIGSLLPKNDP